MNPAEVPFIPHGGAIALPLTPQLAILVIGRLPVGLEESRVGTAVDPIAIRIDRDEAETGWRVVPVVPHPTTREFNIEIPCDPLFDKGLGRATPVLVGRIIPGATRQSRFLGNAEELEGVHRVDVGGQGTIELVAGEVELEPPVDHGLGESQAVDQHNRLVAELPHRYLGVKGRPLRRVDRADRREIHRGPALGDPLHRPVVVGPRQRRDVAVDAIVLAIDGDLGPGERLRRDPERDAFLVAAFEVAKLAFAVEESVEPHRELVLDEGAIVVDREAMRPPRVVAPLKLRNPAIEPGPLGP